MAAIVLSTIEKAIPPAGLLDAGASRADVLAALSDTQLAAYASAARASAELLRSALPEAVAATLEALDREADRLLGMAFDRPRRQLAAMIFSSRLLTLNVLAPRMAALGAGVAERCVSAVVKLLPLAIPMQAAAANGLLGACVRELDASAGGLGVLARCLRDLLASRPSQLWPGAIRVIQLAFADDEAGTRPTSAAASEQWVEGADALVSLLFDHLAARAQPRSAYLAAGAALSLATRRVMRAGARCPAAHAAAERWYERSLRLPLTPVHRGLVAALTCEALGASHELAAFAIHALRQRAEAQLARARAPEQHGSPERLEAAVTLASLLFGTLRQVRSRPILAAAKDAVERVVLSAANPARPETLASATGISVALMHALQAEVCSRTPAYERPSLARWYLDLAGRVEGVLDDMSWAAQGPRATEEAWIRSRL